MMREVPLWESSGKGRTSLNLVPLGGSTEAWHKIHGERKSKKLTVQDTRNFAPKKGTYCEK